MEKKTNKQPKNLTCKSCAQIIWRIGLSVPAASVQTGWSRHRDPSSSLRAWLLRHFLARKVLNKPLTLVDGRGEEAGLEDWLEAEWVSVPRVRKDIFGFHFYGVIVKNKRRTSTTRFFEWCEQTDLQRFPTPSGVSGWESGKPQAPVGMSADRSNWSPNCKMWPPFKGAAEDCIRILCNRLLWIAVWCWLCA